MKNLASIIITNYNKQKFVKRSILSALNQSYLKKEIIFFDDCSTDNSLRIVKKFNKVKIIQNKLKKFSSAPLNQINAIIKSFTVAKGEYIFLLDSDDEFKKNKVKNMLNYFKKNKKLNIIQDKPYLGKQKKIMKLKKKFHFFSIWPGIYPTSCIVLKKKYFIEFLNYVEKSKFPNLEIDSRLVIYAFLKKDLKIINKSFTVYNFDESGITSNYKKFSKKWWIKRKEAFNYMELLMKKFKIKLKKGPDFYFTKLINLFY